MSLLLRTARRIDQLVSAAQTTGQVPSLIAGVVRDGALVHVAAAGDRPTPDADVQYRIGSITKTMTAALVMRLRDEGRLALEDPLDRHLPGTPVGRATLRQLLGHASGLQREPNGQWWERVEGASVEALLAGLTPEKLARPAYRTFHYSNLAYGLLGAVVERVTGEPWFGLLQRRVLRPLGMHRTAYEPVAPFAPGYVVHPWHGTLREEPRTDTRAMAPAGQLWSTVADLARWAAFLARPVPRVLAPDTVTEMSRPVIMSDPDAWTGAFGLGLELYRRGERVFVGHGGSMPGYVATLLVHRPSRSAVVTYANAYGLRRGHLSETAAGILETVIDAEPHLAPTPWRSAAAPPPEEVAALCGRWWWMGREYEAAWESERAELVVSLIAPGGQPPWRFVRERPDRWRGRSGLNDGETLAVRRGADGGVDTLDIAAFVLTRDPDRVP
jgi:CubicO group peptidase (beta-lactamase class C family)